MKNEKVKHTLSLGEIVDWLQQYYSHAYKFLRHHEIENLRKNQQFDLVIVGYAVNDFLLGIAAHFQCPSVMITPNQINFLTQAYTGNPSSISYNPSVWSGYSTQMTLRQRIVNFLSLLVEKVVYFVINYFVMEPCYANVFPPPTYPSFTAVKDNVSLVLLANQNLADSTPIPLMPNVIYVGGMHLHAKRNPLSKDMQTFLDSAADGVIYFSLGGNLNSSNLPKHITDIFINEFAQLKQRVLFKWENNTLGNKPDNIFISKWMPQLDVLAHSNTILFVSHCGLGSVNEAKFYGVPLLCIPFYGDQFYNLKKVSDEGWGTGMNYGSFDRSMFSLQLNKMLSDDQYRRRAKELSQLIRDEPMNPLERAAFWVEYVLRHNGAKHLKSPAKNLNFLQFNYLDVIAILAICLYVVAKCPIFVYRFLKHSKFISTKVKIQ